MRSLDDPAKAGMKNEISISRRRFIKAAAALAIPSIVPRSALGGAVFRLQADR